MLAAPIEEPPAGFFEPSAYFEELRTQSPPLAYFLVGIFIAVLFWFTKFLFANYKWPWSIKMVIVIGFDMMILGTHGYYTHRFAISQETWAQMQAKVSFNRGCGVCFVHNPHCYRNASTSQCPSFAIPISAVILFFLWRGQQNVGKDKPQTNAPAT